MPGEVIWESTSGGARREMGTYGLKQSVHIRTIKHKLKQHHLRPSMFIPCIQLDKALDDDGFLGLVIARL